MWKIRELAKIKCNTVLKPKLRDQVTEQSRRQRHQWWMVLLAKWAKAWIGFRILRPDHCGATYYWCYLEIWHFASLQELPVFNGEGRVWNQSA